MKKVLCMGCINMDLNMYMDHLPRKGETVRGYGFSTVPGGKGGNQAATVATLGGNAVFLTKLGDDIFSRELTEILTKKGVDMSHVITIPGGSSGIAMIRIDDSGRNSISFDPGSNMRLAPDDIYAHEELFKECDILLAAMEIRTDTVYAAIEMAKEHGMTVILDPAPAPPEGIPHDIAKMIDYAKPNASEAGILTETVVDSVESAETAFRVLKDIGIGCPIITLGKGGLLTEIDGEVVHIPGQKVNVLDTTAAGDIFIGAFTAALSNDVPFKECIEYASKAAALSTTVYGAMTSIPSKDMLS